MQYCTVSALGCLALGIDIGTTSVSFTVADIAGRCQAMHRSVPNDSILDTAEPWRREQDPGRILETVQKVTDEILEAYPGIAAIGLTGQMHGVLYLDGEGNALSNLVTWQDARGNLPNGEGMSYAEKMTERTGMPVSTGFGLVTHYYNICCGLVPAAAHTLCTVMDYVGMRMTGRTSPLMHATNAASLGLFDVEAGTFRTDAAGKLDMDPAILPEVTSAVRELGLYRGIPVYTAVGDNQASFFGSVADEDAAVLVNYGTGSQISMTLPGVRDAGEAEVRPYFDGKFLLSGAALCGGRAYALMERFFRGYAAAIGAGADEQYGTMNALAQEVYGASSSLTVRTTFAGTRRSPGEKGAIEDIDEENFTPGQLILGTLRGMAEELYRMYIPHADESRRILVASGNAVDRNPVLRQVLEDTFGMHLVRPDVREAAAFGAALLAARSAGMADACRVKACVGGEV